ncbi:MAG TPA: glycosyltransferase family 9 protein, partial [Ilumatobacteraceae bacterium]|nr:glycosyltransferase family 9 protein [Ilumatobacteraceae bacterium]
PTVNLAGRTSLGTLAALMARASIVVVNDTGTAHLAAAVGTPTVTLFGASDRQRWAVRGARHRSVAGRAGRWPPVARALDAVNELMA